ncbi:MAG: serine/threonine protein kinase, partial [Planctomycetes bacterium]|nr:serine/threonine protein kinase [Planctomycetota bacterium]
MQVGPYEVQKELARGGMGVVYLAREPGGEEVALKVLLAGALSDPEQELRFRREAEALEALDHPGILRVRAHGVADGRPYTVMDLLRGPTLADAVKAEGPLPEGRARALGQRMAAALAHAHGRGVLHRDLKPENVILRAPDDPVLVDFGLVLQLGLERTRLTETGTILGSPRYMAPEQALGHTDLGPAVDVYALGATLYFLLTGRPPFDGASVLGILSQVVNDPPRPLRELRPELSPALEARVLRCLEKEPARRFASAQELERALGGAGRGASPAR